jgi:methionine aminotransferase
LSDLSEAEFCRWLTTEVGVAAIPLSAFYEGGFEQRIVRFCFAKKDETLRAALQRLARL